jgi:hypothetical protein
MAAVNPKNLSYEGILLTASDYVAGNDEGTALDPGEIGEVAVAEVGEDGQLSAYEAVRLGDTLGPTGNSPQGKLFVDLRDDSDAELDPRTQIRWICRDKNSNRRPPITRWYPLRDLNEDDPRLRTALPPVTKNNKPFFVKEGRILSLEIKNESTGVTMDLGKSTFETPSRAGY